MVEIPFLKKLALPKFSLEFLTGKPSRIVGIDIGVHSAKVVQLRYERERAILETYGELLSEGYLKSAETTSGGGFLRYLDTDIVNLLKDLLREANVTAKDAALSIPSTASFITTISLPKLNPKEIEETLPYEARKYVPIPITEVVLDWEILDTEEDDNSTVLLAAVPKEIIGKFKRIAELAGIKTRALEVETFSLVRSLVGLDTTPTAIINLGHLSTTLAIVDKRRLRVSHNFSRGSQELTRSLEKGLGITRERAEAIKREVGLAEKIEEKEIASIIEPIVETLFSEVERLLTIYNRHAPRRVQKINLTGGGSNLKGLIDYASTRLGLEVTRGNPFSRIMTPAFMQPILREIGPSLAVAVGLALHEITNR